MRDVSDSRLVAAARAGDKDSFAALVDRHYARVRALTRAFVGDDADDVAQEAVLQAYLGLEHLRHPERFGAWLYGIAVNLARMRLRRARLGARVAAVVGPRAATDDVEAAHDAALVREALDELTPAQRETVLMHDVVGLSAAEIATKIGGSSGAVRVRLHRGRRALRSQLRALAPTTKEEKTMIEVELRDVVARVDEGGGDGGEPRLVAPDRVVLLQERGGQRVLPIWVGAPEGDSLALHLGNESMPRPLTAELMAKLLEAVGARVDRVEVSKLIENTFYGVVHVRGADGQATAVDARPSDAVNLAVRVGAPMLVDEGVFTESALAAAGADELDEELARACAKHGLAVPPGTWQSVSPDLVRSAGAFRAWRPPAAGAEEPPAGR